MCRLILTLGVLLTGVPVVLASQSAVTASPGSRVRVSVEESIPPATKKRIIGTLVSVSDESGILRSTNGNDQQSLTQTGIAPAHSLLDVLAPNQLKPVISVRKEKRKLGRYVLGALIGGGIGALAGLGLYEAIGCEVEEPPRTPCEGICFYTSECSPSRGASMGVGALLGGVVGLVAAATGS